jgi:alkanesulfonate monooxygenase SsuD/methylene tetrahydromethanopterin reductase-like flavin-dependent oxidoreductase (luciferase family)
MSRQIYVAPTDAQAQEEGRAFMTDYYQASSASPAERQAARAMEAARYTERSFAYKTTQHISRPRMETVDCDWLLDRGYCILGSPDTVIRAIKEQERITGVGLLLTYLPWGQMTLAQASRSLELFGKEVLPHLRD